MGPRSNRANIKGGACRGLSREGHFHRGRIIVARALFAFLFGHGSICRRQLSAMHQPLPRPMRTHLWFPTVRRRGRSRSSTRLARLVAVHDRRARCVWFDRGAIVSRLDAQTVLQLSTMVQMSSGTKFSVAAH
jgi:hypothetical protein